MITMRLHPHLPLSETGAGGRSFDADGVGVPGNPGTQGDSPMTSCKI